MQAAARHEWRNYWILPLVAALGNSASVLHIYSLGPFMEPLNQEFGWNRAEVSLGVTVANILCAVIGVGVGFLLDKFGPRLVGLIGVVIMTSAFASLGTATGSIENWIMHWAFVAIGAAWVQPTIWTSAVASRFDVSRGLAIALTISGSGIAAAAIPALATWLIVNYGWRYGFYGLGMTWAIALLPLLLLFFRGKQDRQKQTPVRRQAPAGDSLPGMTLAQGLRSAALYKLGIAGMVFSFAVIGLVVHFVPVLHDSGLDMMTAASIAGIIGLSSIVGRLGTGILLDRFPPQLVGMCAFLLPVLAAILLLSVSGPFMLSIAALTVGLSIGSELDVILYLATRHFGLKRFGQLFTIMAVALSVGVALGPVSAGAIYDHFGTYRYFILLMIPLSLLGSVLLATLGRAPDHHLATDATPA